MEIRTKRLLLRNLRVTDAESMYEYAKDPDVALPASWPPHRSMEDSRAFIRSVMNQPREFGVCKKEDGVVIGCIGLKQSKQKSREPSPTEWEVGYWIGKPFWGQGLIPEAIRALQRYIFTETGCTGLWCCYSDGNEKSKKCMSKCGFTYHHTEENVATHIKGDIRTVHYMFIDRSEWARLPDAQKEDIAVDMLVTVRNETKKDYRTVENLVRDSFWNVYRPGCMEHYVLHRLRDNPDFVKELDFVMEKNGKIIGQNVFVKAKISADDGREIPILTMGPLCIAPELKRQGYGKYLLDYSLQKAKELGYGGICFEGNLLFYENSGFKLATEYGLRYHGFPEDEIPTFFLAKELIPGYFDGVTGEYATPNGYFVCEEEPEQFEKYESGFPYKEKLTLPGQLG